MSRGVARNAAFPVINVLVIFQRRILQGIAFTGLKA